MQYAKQGHAIYYIRYHVVVATKYRRKILNPGMGSYLKIKVREVRKQYPDIHFVEVNTDKDHMHLLIALPPKLPVSDAVRIIKTNTAKAMREKFRFLDTVYWGSKGIWSVGYFVSTLGVNEKIIQKYIQLQGREDSGQAKLGI